MTLNRALFLCGVTCGASIWSTGTFFTFHLLHYYKLIENELAWAIVQGCTTGLLVILTYFASRHLRRKLNG